MSTQKEQPAAVREKQTCLSPEDLSAALDGEHSFTPEELLHLEHCKKCKELYESYKLLDDVLSHTLDIKCPAASMKRIRQKVAYNTGRGSSLPDEEKKGFDFIAWGFRVAAMLVLFGAAGYLIWKDYTSTRESKTSYADVPVSAPSSGGAELVPASAGRGVLSGEPAVFGGVDIRDLNLISSGTSHATEFVDPAAVQPRSATGRRVELIPKEVNHVWLYEPSLKASGMEKIFRSALEKAELPLNRIKFDLSKDGTLRADLELTRLQAVQLVRALASRKLMLLNSAQPQPEQRFFAGTGKEPVHYKVLFIARNGK